MTEKYINILERDSTQSLAIFIVLLLNINVLNGGVCPVAQWDFLKWDIFISVYIFETKNLFYLEIVENWEDNDGLGA